MAETVEPRELGLRLAALRRPHERTCAYCGAAFVRVGKGRFCSDQHAKLHWWHTHRGNRRPTEPEPDEHGKHRPGPAKRPAAGDQE